MPGARETLFALFECDSWRLSLGEPLEELPTRTWAEVWTEEYGSFEEGVIAWHGYTLAELQSEEHEELLAEIPRPDDEAPWEFALHTITTPERAAFERLSSLDLAPDGQYDEALGDLEFWEADGGPGSDYYGVHATSHMALSCLQHRLEVLGTGVQIRVI